MTDSPSREDVATLLSYERAHGDRPPVIQVLEPRGGAGRCGRVRGRAGDRGPAGQSSVPRRSDEPRAAALTGPGHVPMIDDPDLVAADIRNWSARCGSD